MNPSIETSSTMNSTNLSAPHSDSSSLSEQTSVELVDGAATKAIAADQPLRSDSQPKHAQRTTADVLRTGGHLSC